MTSAARTKVVLAVLLTAIGCGEVDQAPVQEAAQDTTSGAAASEAQASEEEAALDRELAELEQLQASYPDSGLASLGFRFATCSSNGLAVVSKSIGPAGNENDPLVSPNGHRLIIHPGTLTATRSFRLQDHPVNGCRVNVVPSGLAKPGGYTLEVSCRDRCAAAIPELIRLHAGGQVDRIPGSIVDGRVVATLDELSSYVIAIP